LFDNAQLISLLMVLPMNQRLDTPH